MQDEKHDCPCSKAAADVRPPVEPAHGIPSEAYDVLRSAAVPAGFNDAVDDLIAEAGLPSATGWMPAEMPRVDVTNPAGGATFGVPVHPFDTPIMVPATPYFRPGSEPEPASDVTVSYLGDWRLDLTGVAHMTSGLQELADLPLDRMLCETQGEAGWTFLCFQDEGGGENGGGPPGDGPDDTPITTERADCTVSVFATVRMRKQRAPAETAVETYSLADGFDEIVIPAGYEATVRLRPDAANISPYPGTITGAWTIKDSGTVLFRGSRSGGQADIRKGFKKDGGTETFREPGTLPVSRTHEITASWTTSAGRVCSLDPKTFTVTFARSIPLPPRINLGGFYNGAKRGGFGGGTGTRVVQGDIGSRDENVLVPIAIYWETGGTCCGVEKFTMHVIQFARGLITGPNGRQGKPWTLDILPAARTGAPDHDPTFTNQPGNDADETPTAEGGGGTRREGQDLGQWDAPGMAKRLYDQLAAAQGMSIYRQQFLSLLVCRPQRGDKSKHGAPFYRDNAWVRSILVLTVRWTFPGGGLPPTVTTSLFAPPVDCIPLGWFLRDNGFLDRFNNPAEDARKLKILSPTEYKEAREDVEKWERNPFGELELP